MTFLSWFETTTSQLVPRAAKARRSPNRSLHNLLRSFAAVSLACVCHCAGAGGYLDDAGATDAAFTQDSRVPPSGDAAAGFRALSCAPTGTASLQVRVQVAPALPDGDVWVAVACGTLPNTPESELTPARLIKLSRSNSMMTMIENLGEGYYRVLASIGGNPSGDSGPTLVRLTDSLTAAAFVVVNPPTRPRLADVSGTLQAPPPDGGGAPDAGVARDGGGARQDAGGPGAMDPYDLVIAAPMVQSVAGRVVLRVRPRADGNVDAAFLLANVLPRASDPTLRVSNIELRIDRAAMPAALLSLSLGPADGAGTALLPATTFITDSRILPMGVFDRTTRFRLTVFGAFE